MTPASVLLGSARSRSTRHRYLLLSVGLFVTVFAGYAVGVFSVSGGVVFIPYYAAVVGMVAALGVGYARGGLAIAWLVTYASVLGYHADHAFVGLPSRTFREQLGYFLRPDGLAFLAVEGVVLGTIAWTLGALLQWTIGGLRRRAA